jgi:hypothetical protein
VDKFAHNKKAFTKELRFYLEGHGYEEEEVYQKFGKSK